MRLLAFALMLAASACELVSKERIPTEADIREWTALQPFVATCADIRGVYQNIDVDSVVFYCRPRDESESDFWLAVRQRASAVGWVADSRANHSYPVNTFLRMTLRRGQERFSSSEEIRVAWIGDRVVVGYVQADHSGKPTPVNEALEGRFAEKSVWPRFNGLLSR